MYISLFKSFIIYLISKFYSFNQPVDSKVLFSLTTTLNLLASHIAQQESDIFKFKLGVTDEIRQHRLA